MYERASRPDRDEELEQLLAGGLAEAGAAGGRIGADGAGAAGGAAGGRLAARIVSTSHHEQEIEGFDLPPDAGAEAAGQALNELGRVEWAEPDERGGYDVRGVIGSGWLNMNTAVVDVHLDPDAPAVVRAAAKEGLIKQRTAEKAVRRVIEEIYKAAPPS